MTLYVSSKKLGNSQAGSLAGSLVNGEGLEMPSSLPSSLRNSNSQVFILSIVAAKAKSIEH